MSLALAAYKAGPDAVVLAGGNTSYRSKQFSVAEVERLAVTSLRCQVHPGMPHDTAIPAAPLTIGAEP